MNLLSMFHLPRIAERAAAPLASTTRPLEIGIIRDLATLEPLWQQVSRGGDSSVFQSYDVIRAWVQRLAAALNVQWLVVVIFNARTHEPLLLLPLIIHRVAGMTVIEGADLGVADFFGPAVARGFLPTQAEMLAVWTLFKRALPPADVLRLSKMPARLGKARNPLLLLSNVNRTKLSNFKAELDPDWERWMAANVPEKVRADLKARTRKLAKRGVVTFRTAETEADADKFFETLITQRQARFKALGRCDVLDCPNYRAFYRRLLRPGDHNSVGQIQALCVGDEIIAVGYGLVFNDAFHMIFPSFKAEGWRNYSPGLQLFIASMKQAAARGLKHYDFTIGGEAFKRDLGAEEFPLFEKLTALSLRGQRVVYADRLRRFVQRNPKFARMAARLRGCSDMEGSGT